MKLIEFPYNRELAVAYAHRWAYGRNPEYFDFQGIGGDCTNFASQCIYAGAGVMNYTPVYGWYYITANDRTASWTGVQYLYNFLTGNLNAGPFGTDTVPNAARRHLPARHQPCGIPSHTGHRLRRRDAISRQYFSRRTFPRRGLPAAIQLQFPRNSFYPHRSSPDVCA